MVQFAAMNAKQFSGVVGALVLVSSLVGCVVGLRNFQSEDLRTPQRLSALPVDPPDRLEVDATVVNVDVHQGLVKLQLTWRPQGRLLARPGSRELAEDIEIVTNAAQGAHAITLAKGHVPHGVEVALDLSDGDIGWYPIDRYRTRLEIDASTRGTASSSSGDGSGNTNGNTGGPVGGTGSTSSTAATAATSATPVPLRLNFVSRQHVMHVEASLEPTSSAGEVDAALTMQRPGVARGFAAFMHTLMLVVAAAAFIVAFNIGWRNKKPEGPLLVWMSALLFVLPAFRGMLPGNPPLGVLSDYLVFFWVEGLVALCLLISVLAWSRRGTAG